MSQLIAKKYTKALTQNIKVEELEEYRKFTSNLLEASYSQKFVDIMDSPEVPKAKKLELIQKIANSTNKRFNNFLNAISQYNRFTMFGEIYKELSLEISNLKNSYDGVVYSTKPLEVNELKDLQKQLSSKLQKNISLTQKESKNQEIKVEVEQLNLEIWFSKNRFESAIIEHILKAI